MSKVKKLSPEVVTHRTEETLLLVKLQAGVSLVVDARTNEISNWRKWCDARSKRSALIRFL